MPGWVNDHSVMRMGIVQKKTDTLIGYCHIDHRTEDMSAWLSINIGEKAARGKGIGTEVVQILLRYCFMVLGVYSVHLDVLETNTPAIKCYEKAGFRISGRYRGHCYYMLPGEEIQYKSVRFRTLGCYPLTGGTESTATTLDEIIDETLSAVSSERTTRVIDNEAAGSMERRKREGYF